MLWQRRMRETQFGLKRKSNIKISLSNKNEPLTGLSRGDSRIGPFGAHASAGRRNASRSNQK